MANIFIVGFEKLEATVVRDKVDAVIKRIGKAENYRTTILDAETKYCFAHGRAPYLIVRDTLSPKARYVAAELHAALNLDIEIELIYGFLESVIWSSEG